MLKLVTSLLYLYYSPMGWWKDLRPIGRAGVLALAAAVVAIAITIANKSNSGNTSANQPVISEHQCELTAGALGLIATGLREHETAETILGSMGAAGFLCDSIVKLWVANPAQEQTVPIGGTDQTVSGTQVSSAVDSNWDHFVQCLDAYAPDTWQRTECIDYQLSP